jgi:hypothetical protein
MENANALPNADQAVASDQPSQAEQLDQTTKEEGQLEQGQETADAKEDQPKPEKTPEQREIERLRRRIDRKTEQLGRLREQISTQPLQNGRQQSHNQDIESDSEQLSLTREQLAELVRKEAESLAPTLQQQRAQQEQFKTAVKSLADHYGDRFDAVTEELDDLVGGLADASNRPTPVTRAILEAENRAEVIDYLIANPSEASDLAEMSEGQAFRYITKIEAKLQAAKDQDKPKPSKAPAPIEGARGIGKVTSAPDPSNIKAWIQHQNRLEAQGKL